MADLKKKLNAILSDLDKNVKNKEDLEYVKSQIYNISMLFLDEIDKLAEMNIEKMNAMIEREKDLSNRINAMEKMIENIESEMIIDDEPLDFTIQCPYCNAEFVEDFTSGFKREVKCPECDNIVQLEWSPEDESIYEQEDENTTTYENEQEESEDNDEEDDM